MAAEQRPLILVADDDRASRNIMRTRLEASHYEVELACDGNEALRMARDVRPDLILLDVMMPEIDGIEVCRRLRADTTIEFAPVIIISAKSQAEDVVAGLEAGADEYVTKPLNHTELMARVRSMLRVKRLHDQANEQAETLKIQAAELEKWNEQLEQRVAEQTKQLERIGELRRFFSPKIADLILSPRGRELLKSHRREVAVLFCDLRGFTYFSRLAEPEDQLRILREYHEEIGCLVARHDATIERLAGDGVMMFFNDPIPCTDPAWRAVRFAVELRQSLSRRASAWRQRGFELGFGVGVALGFATLGQVGFEGHFHYSAIGTVANLASRLCDSAKDGQILLDRRLVSEVEGRVEVEDVGSIRLKGFPEEVTCFNLVSLEHVD